MERVEQSWESHRSELFEVAVSNMALPSGVVSSMNVIACTYSTMLKV